MQPIDETVADHSNHFAGGAAANLNALPKSCRAAPEDISIEGSNAASARKDETEDSLRIGSRRQLGSRKPAALAAGVVKARRVAAVRL
jgi:hypothetical protein